VGDKSVETAARLSKYDPASRVTWAAGAPVPYKFLADTFEQMANVSARLEKTELLTNVFRSVIASTPDDLLPMVYLRCAFDDACMGEGHRRGHE
jgi:DNA ligase-1